MNKEAQEGLEDSNQGHTPSHTKHTQSKWQSWDQNLIYLSISTTKSSILSAYLLLFRLICWTSNQRKAVIKVLNKSDWGKKGGEEEPLK